MVKGMGHGWVGLVGGLGWVGRVGWLVGFWIPKIMVQDYVNDPK